MKLRISQKEYIAGMSLNVGADSFWLWQSDVWCEAGSVSFVRAFQRPASSFVWGRGSSTRENKVSEVGVQTILEHSWTYSAALASGGDRFSVNNQMQTKRLSKSQLPP